MYFIRRNYIIKQVLKNANNVLKAKDPKIMSKEEKVLVALIKCLENQSSTSLNSDIEYVDTEYDLNGEAFYKQLDKTIKECREKNKGTLFLTDRLKTNNKLIIYK